MQNEQRLLQPSCTLRLGRVFSGGVFAIEDRRGQQFGVGEDVADDNVRRGSSTNLRQRHESGRGGQRESVVSDFVLVGISDDQADARQSGQLFRSALGIAAGDQNLRGRVLAMDPPDGGAHVLIGRRGDRAGVQDDDFGLARRAGARQPAIQQLTLDRGAIRLGRAASEVLHVIRRHPIIIRTGNQRADWLRANRPQEC